MNQLEERSKSDRDGLSRLHHVSGPIDTPHVCIPWQPHPFCSIASFSRFPFQASAVRRRGHHCQGSQMARFVFVGVSFQGSIYCPWPCLVAVGLPCISSDTGCLSVCRSCIPIFSLCWSTRLPPDAPPSQTANKTRLWADIGVNVNNSKSSSNIRCSKESRAVSTHPLVLHKSIHDNVICSGYQMARSAQVPETLAAHPPLGFSPARGHRDSPHHWALCALYGVLVHATTSPQVLSDP